jgi:hypothetical protein
MQHLAMHRHNRGIVCEYFALGLDLENCSYKQWFKEIVIGDALRAKLLQKKLSTWKSPAFLWSFFICRSRRPVTRISHRQDSEAGAVFVQHRDGTLGLMLPEKSNVVFVDRMVMVAEVSGFNVLRANWRVWQGDLACEAFAQQARRVGRCVRWWLQTPERGSLLQPKPALHLCCTVAPVHCIFRNYAHQAAFRGCIFCIWRSVEPFLILPMCWV